ncbi:DNA-directed RNA polymerase subunit beta [Sutcliffiella rhizosphaerae]|uniref:DNA-directed RNA polymerase subunit beta n=1 Tax=Sutcliffiella rhizosphaerae TaxID=2880967 RepID=A0ABN8A993_9BACI|nr:DNA-directed RNA polymerase subunit beta [Sutcliffiella rhizosphaerae]CAG9620187.1 hypothetical protein BACCIP111883_00955 [Sutcliffiella rhizosphaerae]
MGEKEEQKSLTREELRKAQKKQAKEENTEEVVEQSRPERIRWRIRLIPIWLRLIIILAVMAIALIAGSMFGYAVLGGGEPMDVFKKETWQHILDLVNKE